MLSRAEAHRALARVAPVLERHPELVCAYAFGSVLDERRKTIRDVDFGILGAGPLTLGQIGGLCLDLGGIFGDSVDIVDLAAARRGLRFEVLSKGLRLLDRDPARSARLREETLREHLAARHVTLSYYRRLGRALYDTYAHAAR
jgi:hypothetical protein